MSLEGNFVDFLRISDVSDVSERFRMYPDGAVLLRVANSIHQARVKLVHKKSGHYRPPGDASPEPFQTLRMLLWRPGSAGQFGRKSTGSDHVQRCPDCSDF